MIAVFSICGIILVAVEAEAGGITTSAETTDDRITPAKFYITPKLGLGWVTESKAGSSRPQAVLGTSADYLGFDDFLIHFAFTTEFYSRTYLSSLTSPQSGYDAQVAVNERLLDLSLTGTYNLSSIFPEHNRFSVKWFGPVLGFQTLAFLNSVFPSNAGGPTIGAHFAANIAPDVTFTTGLQHVYNLFFENNRLFSLKISVAPYISTNYSVFPE